VIRWRAVPKVLVGAVLLLAAILLPGSSVKGQPLIPMRCFGVAYYNDRPVEDGTSVEARFEGDVYSVETQTIDAQKGKYEGLNIPYFGSSPYPDVRFFVGGVEAEESPERWTSGFYPLDLHAPAAALETDVVAPERVGVGAEYAVSATIDNVGRGDASGVTAVLSVTEGAGLAAGDIPTRTIGTLDASHAETVTWTLVCSNSMPVTITVTPGGTDQNRGEPIPAIDIDPGSAVVVQQTPAALVTTIEEPPPDEAVGVGGEFEVTAAISNTGQTEALSVTAALTWTSGAELISGPALQDLDTISGESAALVTWTLQCTSTEEVTVTVTPAGIDGGSGGPAPAEGAWTTVEQVPSPYLETSIVAPRDGTRFLVGT